MGFAIREVVWLHILSNAVNTPDFSIVFTGETCVRLGDRPMCGLCGAVDLKSDICEICDNGNFDEMDDYKNACQTTCLALGNCSEQGRSVNLFTNLA